MKEHAECYANIRALQKQIRDQDKIIKRLHDRLDKALKVILTK